MSGTKIKRDSLAIGDKVLGGRYEVRRVIKASRGMSNVYLVLDSQLNKQWCMKEIRMSYAKLHSLEYKSIIREANIMKNLNHPNIPRIVTMEKDGDSLFIIMDYITGSSIWEKICDLHRIPQNIAVDWMKQICQVMMYLHNRKNPIFYRDMKPENVMIQNDGSVKLLDFGISLVLKESGQRIAERDNVGTIGYAAPEQRKVGNIADIRGDIYAMGRTFYAMLTGLDLSAIEKESKKRGVEVVLKPVRELDSSISVGIEKIITKCCQPDPEKRYQSCEELLYALQNYETLDTKYRSKMRNKVYGVMGLFLTGVFLVTISIIPFRMDKAQQEKTYNNLLNVAQQSGRIEDYMNVLSKDATSLVPYEGMIDAIKVDGIFSKVEEQQLLNYVNPNLDTIRQNKGYGEFAYNMGKLYWFFYEGASEDEGIITSIKWFRDAIEKGYNTELADVYYQLASFKKNIAVSITESNDSGMYSKYWNNLILAKEKDNGELVNLQLNLSIANCISTYVYNLKQDGVSYDDISKQIKDLNTFVWQYTPSIEKAKTSYDLLQSTVEGLQDKVDSIYKEG